MKARRILPRRLLLLVAMALAVLPAGSVAANAAAPADHVWLVFAGSDGAPVEPQAVQLLLCHDAACTDPQLLLQSGDCTAASCVAGPAAQTDWPDRIQCHDSRCLVSAYFEDPEWPYGQIVAQINHTALRSQGGWPLPVDELGADLPLEVTVGAAGLELAPHPGFEEPGLGDRSLAAGLAITVLSELAVAALWIVLRDRQRVLRRLLLVLLVNLGTLPAVWVFFPAQAPFFSSAGRLFGVIILVLSLLYGLLLVWSFRSQTPKDALIRGFGSAAILTASLMVAGLIAFVGGYGSGSNRATAGLSQLAILVLAELYAWLVEAAVYWLGSRGELSPWRALELSLLANAASFGLGAWLLGF